MTEAATAEPGLGPAGEAQWSRLRRQLEYADGFWLGFVFSASPAPLRVLQRRTENLLRAQARGQRVIWPRSPAELEEQAAHIVEQVGDGTLGCLWPTALDVDAAGDHDGLWRQAWDRALLAFNQARQPLRKRLGAGLIIAAPVDVKPRIREAAPDLWSIRAIVIDIAERDGALGHNDTAAHETTHHEPERARLPTPRRGGGRAPASEELRDLLRAADRLIASDRSDEAVEVANDAAALARAAGDTSSAAGALAILSEAESAAGDIGAATDHTDEAIELLGDGDDTATLIPLLDRAGELALARGDLDRAITAFEQLLALERTRIESNPETPDALRDLSVSLDNIGDTRLQAGDLAAATAAYDESLTLRRRLLDTYGQTPQALRDLAFSLAKVSDARHRADDNAGAQALAEAATDVNRRLERYDAVSATDDPSGVGEG